MSCNCNTDPCKHGGSIPNDYTKEFWEKFMHNKPNAPSLKNFKIAYDNLYKPDYHHYTLANGDHAEIKQWKCAHPGCSGMWSEGIGNTHKPPLFNGQYFCEQHEPVFTDIDPFESPATWDQASAEEIMADVKKWKDSWKTAHMPYVPEKPDVKVVYSEHEYAYTAVCAKCGPIMKAPHAESLAFYVAKHVCEAMVRPLEPQTAEGELWDE